MLFLFARDWSGCAQQRHASPGFIVNFGAGFRDPCTVGWHFYFFSLAGEPHYYQLGVENLRRTLCAPIVLVCSKATTS